jgi:hypothetical protein
MGSITLYRDRLVARRYSEEETVQTTTVVDLARYFFHTVALDPAFTLGDLFALLDRDDVAFLELVLGEHVVPLLREARVPPDPDDDLRVDYLRVYNEHGDGRLFRGFDGWGPWNEPYDGAWSENPDWPRAGGISVSLVPVNRLSRIPLRYDPALVFSDEDGAETYRTEIEITLIEFLKAIFFDLTFHGNPEERDETREELDRRFAEIRSGEVEAIPADVLLEELPKRAED